ncbi:MAG TPA: hypothetical protein VL486_13470 [Verrucomicrobiae bacterium]|nr:hypothetical protein [Verrucomicrobiae bacterium]
MNDSSDIIVVGSGASGVHVAWPLVEAGLTVTMLDTGVRDEVYEPLVPARPYTEVRCADARQHRYLLGDNFEGIPLGQLGAGPQLTPPRQFVFRHAEALTPTRSPEFEAVESLALGGLAGAWGAVSFPYLDGELRQTGLPANQLRKHYETVARRIGVSGDRSDDLSRVRGPLEALQPPLLLDSHAEQILARYERKRDALHRAGCYVGQTLLAALTRDLGERKAHTYYDMDFWSNAGGSVYRPALSVKDLGRSANFRYRPSYLVETFAESSADAVRVRARSLASNRVEEFEARRLILAAGALGTTRIVLRSLGQYDVRVPLTSNPHSYIPCVHYRSLGRMPRERRHSLAQLTMVFDPTGDREHLVQSQLYSYGSLMLFRLLQELPLPYRESLRIMRALVPHMVIWVVQHEDRPSPDKYCALRRNREGTGDYLEVVYHLSPESQRTRRANEKRMAGFVRQLGCLPIRTVNTPDGSSIHYAGQFPATVADKPLSTTVNGRLRPTRTVYLADGSAFAYVPAKGLTLTLMANANRLGEHVAQALKPTGSAPAPS